MRRELSATVASTDHAIEVSARGDGRFQVTIDGRALEVDAVEIRPGRWSLLAGGRSLLVEVDRAGSAVAVDGPAGALEVEIDDARRRRLARAMSAARPKVAGEELRAPIAGRVVKLLVQPGETVAAGQGVIVLEAMKMENEIKAERGGVVGKIAVQPGQSVETRALLVVLA